VAANTPSVIQQACGHEFVSFLKLGNSRGDGHVHFFSSTTYAKAGRTPIEGDFSQFNSTPMPRPKRRSCCVSRMFFKGLDLADWKKGGAKRLLL
ncbi:MAG TPA: hypothetical protein VFC78_22185, partial [Tepidisphaeraceae bacterium]|nr:hypothetical protein [Tepidisphaeraceae bacterium]